MNSGVDKTRVLQIVTQLEPAGAQTMAHWLERSLSAERYELRTIFLYAKSPSDMYGPEAALLPHFPRSLVDLLRMFKRLKAEMRGNNQAVIAHTHYSIAACILTGRRRTPIIAVHHWPMQKYPLVARALLRAFGRRIETDVFVSPSIVSDATSTVIPNPVPAIERGRVLKFPAIDILIVARHAVEKDIATALRALPLMPERHLTLVGRGDQTELLRDLAATLDVEDRVTFAGTASRDDVLNMMCGARVVALTSLWEAMPMTILEALACEAPLVVSRIAAHDFVIEPGAAIGFTPGDEASFARAIDCVLQTESRDLQTAGRRAVISAQSESVITRRWAEVIDETVK